MGRVVKGVGSSNLEATLKGPRAEEVLEESVEEGTINVALHPTSIRTLANQAAQRIPRDSVRGEMRRAGRSRVDASVE